MEKNLLCFDVDYSIICLGLYRLSSHQYKKPLTPFCLIFAVLSTGKQPFVVVIKIICYFIKMRKFFVFGDRYKMQ